MFRWFHLPSGGSFLHRLRLLPKRVGRGSLRFFGKALRLLASDFALMHHRDGFGMSVWGREPGTDPSPRALLAPEPAFASAQVSPGLSPLVTSLSSGGQGSGVDDLVLLSPTPAPSFLGCSCPRGSTQAWEDQAP